MLDEILLFLNNNYEGEEYIVKEFETKMYFGKDKYGNNLFARINSTPENKFSIKTKNITVYQNYEYVLKLTDGTEINDKFDILILDSNYSTTLETFIKLCLNFYNNESSSILNLTEDLIELYKVINSGDYISQQGLWGELFTIYYMYEKYNLNIAKCWHTDPYNKYDFSINSNFKIETKSTLKEYREHEFSHEQIYTNNNVIVSSVMLKKDDKGITIEDLYNKIEKLFDDNYEIYLLLEKEMTKYTNNNLLKFNYEYAYENIKFFDNKQMPKFEIPEPNGVHGTKYLVQLEIVESMSEKELRILQNINDF